MNKHTPGPWKSMHKVISPKDGLLKVLIHEQSTDRSISPGQAFGTNEENALANARLIAAAPELLEACKEAFVNYDHMRRTRKDWSKDNQMVYDLLFSAIKKAEGR